MATAAAPQLTRRSGKGRQPALVETVRDLRDELHAITSERDAMRVEIVSLRDLLEIAFHDQSWRLVSAVQSRLASLGATLGRRAAG